MVIPLCCLSAKYQNEILRTNVTMELFVIPPMLRHHDEDPRLWPRAFCCRTLFSRVSRFPHNYIPTVQYTTVIKPKFRFCARDRRPVSRRCGSAFSRLKTFVTGVSTVFVRHLPLPISLCIHIYLYRAAGRPL